MSLMGSKNITFRTADQGLPPIKPSNVILAIPDIWEHSFVLPRKNCEILSGIVHPVISSRRPHGYNLWLTMVQFYGEVGVVAT